MVVAVNVFNKIIMKMNKEIVLTNEELCQLIGGVVSLQEVAQQDVNNLNKVAYCGCIYNNNSAISNTNTADKCACVCR